MKRPLLFFGLMLVGPAAALSWLGYRSVVHEDRLRRAEAHDEARAAVERRIADEVAALEAIRAREDRRPYYHYQARYMPEDLLSNDAPGFVESPLLGAPDDPRVLGWFQWTFSQGTVSGPELFGPGAPAWREPFLAAFGAPLRARLEAAPVTAELRAGRAAKVPLQTVAANEEAGKLIEEVEVAQASKKQSAYLENFQARTQNRARQAADEETVAVRYTPFSFSAAPGDGGPPPLIAWRLVWIPGQVAKDRRDAPTDRWLLQGIALDPLRPAAGPSALAGAPSRVVVTRVGVGGRPPDAVLDSIPRHLTLVPAGPGEPPDAAGAALALVSVPAASPLDEARRADLQRFLSILAGLVAVTGVGFYVLVRSVRREMALAQRKHDFVAAVTHELKTPLAGIRMYADMLKEGWVPEDASPAEYAERIVAETKRLGSLVDQVLDLAAFDRGVARFAPIPGDLGEAVRAAVALTEPAAAEAGVPVVVEVEAGLPLVPFDGSLVRPLVLNLVDNAIKYSARSPTKDVRVAVRSEAGAVAVVVSDRGPGIPASERDRLFQPFSRGGREDTRTARGVGLGLALVRRYADAHRAKITLDSEVGRGTTVTVRFPA